MKKKNGLIGFVLAPYFLLKLIFSVLVFGKTAIQRGVVELNDLVSNADSTDSHKGKVIYKRMAKNLKTPESVAAWHRFVITAMAIQFFLLSMCLLQLIYYNPIMLIESLAAFLVSIVAFGYKTFILETKCYVSVFDYIMVVPHNTHCLLLWNFYNVLEK